MQYDSRRYGDVVMLLVNEAQHVSVAHDLLFAAVAGRGLIAHELGETCIAGKDALDAVGRLDALNPGDVL